MPSQRRCLNIANISCQALAHQRPYTRSARDILAANGRLPTPRHTASRKP